MLNRGFRDDSIEANKGPVPWLWKTPGGEVSLAAFSAAILSVRTPAGPSCKLGELAANAPIQFHKAPGGAMLAALAAPYLSVNAIIIGILVVFIAGGKCQI
jgi:hypothetical protein